MKLNMSENTKKILYCLIGIVMVIVAFFFGFQHYRQENTKLEQQKTDLEAELKRLNEIQANQSDYEAQIKEYKNRIEDYYEEFPVLVQARDQILYASDLESRYDSMFIDKVTMGEAEYIIGTEGDERALFKVPTQLDCYINYEQLKDFLIGTTEDGTRKAVDEIVLTTDETTGSLVGQINISMYYMSGINQEYNPAEIQDVTIGTDNIFQNGATPIQPEDSQQESQEQPQQ